MSDASTSDRAAWEQIAPFWDDYMGDAGNDFHRLLVAPTAERLLALQEGETVLEVACGAGLFARRMAELGATVVATDLTDAFLERARARTAAFAHRISFERIDATDEAALLALGERWFDAAVANMALMDMSAIEPLFRALARLLRPGGRFVFTVTHPCFNNSSVVRTVEESTPGGEHVVTHALKLSKYLGLAPETGLGVIGQPVAHTYYDRPIGELLRPAFAAGFVLDALEEPAFPPPEMKDRSLAMANFSEIPWLLACRLRLAPKE